MLKPQKKHQETLKINSGKRQKLDLRLDQQFFHEIDVQFKKIRSTKPRETSFYY